MGDVVLAVLVVARSTLRALAHAPRQPPRGRASELRPIVAALKNQASNLADQLQRAATSVVLNLAEGQRRQNGNKHSLVLGTHALEARTASELASKVARCIDNCVGGALAYSAGSSSLRILLRRTDQTHTELADCASAAAQDTSP